jgi:hypothetical protein
MGGVSMEESTIREMAILKERMVLKVIHNLLKT